MFLKVSEKELWNLNHFKKIVLIEPQIIESEILDNKNLDPNTKTFQLTENELNTISKNVKYKRPAYGILFIFSEKEEEQDSHCVSFTDRKERDTAFNNLITDMKTETIIEFTPKPHNLIHIANRWIKENQHLVKLGSLAIPTVFTDKKS